MLAKSRIGLLCVALGVVSVTLQGCGGAQKPSYKKKKTNVYSNSKYLADITSGMTLKKCKDYCSTWSETCPKVCKEDKKCGLDLATDARHYSRDESCQMTCAGFNMHSDDHCTLFDDSVKLLEGGGGTFYEAPEASKTDVDVTQESCEKDDGFYDEVQHACRARPKLHKKEKEAAAQKADKSGEFVEWGTKFKAHMDAEKRKYSVAPERKGDVKYPAVPTYEASDYAKIISSNGNGVRIEISPPDMMGRSLTLLHLYGSATERGEAYGHLMADVNADFLTRVFDDFVDQLISNILVEKLPRWLAELLKNPAGAAANKVLQMALGFVEWVQRPYNEAVNNQAHLMEELAGIAKGTCDGIGKDRCDKELGGYDAFHARLARLNMLPELLRMDCTIVGASRSATALNKLVQIRALDFGSENGVIVPFGNYSMVVVMHTDDTPQGSSAYVTFPGFVGTVTGANGHGVALSQKVMYDAQAVGYERTCVTGPLQACIPLTLLGESSPYVLRRIIQLSADVPSAQKIIADTHRTMHFYIGLGDKMNEFKIAAYSWLKVQYWDWQTTPDLTSDPEIKNVAYIDHTTQPNDNRTLYEVLNSKAGDITGEWMATVVPYNTGSGDVHIMTVDDGAQKMYVATGTVNKRNTKFIQYAYQAPAISFDTKLLWNPKLQAQLDAFGGSDRPSRYLRA